MPVEGMFQGAYDVKTSEATGFVPYKKDEIEFLSVWLLQLDGNGGVSAGVWGSAWGAGVDIQDTGTKARDGSGDDQPTWKMRLVRIPDMTARDVRMTAPPRMPGDPPLPPGRQLTAGQAAIGLALYRVKGGDVEAWINTHIPVEDGDAAAGAGAAGAGATAGGTDEELTGGE